MADSKKTNKRKKSWDASSDKGNLFNPDIQLDDKEWILKREKMMWESSQVEEEQSKSERGTERVREIQLFINGINSQDQTDLIRQYSMRNAAGYTDIATKHLQLPPHA